MHAAARRDVESVELSGIVKVKLITVIMAILGITISWSVWRSRGEDKTIDLSEVKQDEKIQSTLPSDQSFLWLEEIEGDDALEWVKGQNAKTLDELTQDPRYATYRAEAEAILTAPDRIAVGRLKGGAVYNFWQDKTHVRGLWRRTSIDDYKSGTPEWETVLDVDKLAAKEDKNWVFGRMIYLEPGNTKCMLSLSPGGSDAAIYREFDMVKKKFVEDGFNLPLAKSSLAWVDENTLLVATDWGEGSLTTSGYARIVKRWRRGTSLKSAETVLEIDSQEMMAVPRSILREDGNGVFISERRDFFSTRLLVMAPGGAFIKLPIPESAELSRMFKGQVIIQLKDDWERDAAIFKAGSLVSFPLRSFFETGKISRVDLVIDPGENATITESLGNAVASGKSVVYIHVLENVTSRVYAYTYDDNGWQGRPVALGENIIASISSADSGSDDVLVTIEDALTPDRLSLLNVKEGKRVDIQSLAAQFDASNLVIEKAKAVSKDGTRIPYFVIRQKDAAFDGTAPTLIYGYGGFDIAILPNYNALVGKLWLEKGGVYVIANIRGGGEFGPKWHQAALLKHRQRAFDDFAAVTEAVQKSGLTSPARTGITGRSNGGLLVGVMATQRPELYNAAVCGVPLLDMRRYDKLLAGASWTAEYGDPDDPNMWAYLKTYSPFHNVRPDGVYPQIYFFTSTKDDRVHPGHARKMAAKFEAYGLPYYYYENMEGGHAGAANLNQTATMRALEFVYLARKLGNDVQS